MKSLVETTNITNKIYSGLPSIVSCDKKVSKFARTVSVQPVHKVS